MYALASIGLYELIRINKLTLISIPTVLAALLLLIILIPSTASELLLLIILIPSTASELFTWIGLGKLEVTFMIVLMLF
ncbi:hypothetical protein IIC_04361 [Bacillus cereus VD021]|uniref:Uncharacterized protein n=1 Tax=Bacillus cereus VD021 TaxID=1053224 RepID=R8HFF0_BACCE|nr:hypothetical protein IIC_04361 [Bacillus cereus VD021]